MKTVAILIALAAAGYAGWQASRLWLAQPAAAVSTAVDAPSTLVRRGTVNFAVNARGELQGGNTEMLTVPMTGGQPVSITSLKGAGESVKPGDVVATLDTTEQEFRLREAEADLAEADQQVAQASAEAEAKIEEARYQLIQARADLKIAELESQRNELLPRLVARQNELALEAARDKLNQLEKDLANRMETARAGIVIQDAARQKARVKADSAKRNIESMTLKAKSSGYVALQSNDEGMIRWGMYLPPYQVGDIARPGKAIAQIPDMRQWEVSARIGELDRGHLNLGQAASLRVVALPDRPFAAKVKTLGGTTGPPWDRHFDCRLALENPAPELRPGMTVEIRVETGKAEDVLWIPSQALFDADGRRYVYLRKPDGTFAPQDVQIVRRSESQVVVTGLREGQAVALVNPELAARKDAKSGGAGGALGALPK